MKMWGRGLTLAACLWLIAQNIEAAPKASGSNKKTEPTSATTCTCGQTQKGRIIGGKRTPTNHYPWVAMLVIRSTLEQFCGAVIITEKVAFTAAHCSKVPDNIKLNIVAGTSDAYEPKRGQIAEVEKTIEPDDYFASEDDNKDIVNDISIVLLATPLKFNANVGPICLPTGKMNLEGKWVKIVGWGKLKAADKYSTRHLHEADIKVKKFSDCQSEYGLKESEKQICTLTSGTGICWGDTGGPVVYLDPETNSYTLAGIMSFMDTECKTDYPMVSTQVSYYLPWIKSKIDTLGCQMVEKDGAVSKKEKQSGKEETTKAKKTEENEKKTENSKKRPGTKIGKNGNKKSTSRKGSGTKKKGSNANQKQKGTNQKKTGTGGKKTGNNTKKTGTAGKKTEANQKEDNE